MMANQPICQECSVQVVACPRFEPAAGFRHLGVAARPVSGAGCDRQTTPGITREKDSYRALLRERTNPGHLGLGHGAPVPVRQPAPRAIPASPSLPTLQRGLSLPDDKQAPTTLHTLDALESESLGSATRGLSRT